MIIDRKILFFSVIAVLCVLIVPNIVFAADAPEKCDDNKTFQLIPCCALGEYNAQRGIYEQAKAPDLACVEKLLVNIARIILAVSGAIALLMFIYGGFLWLTAGGNSSRVQQGTKIMIGTVIGLVIIFGANLAVTTVRNVLQGQGLGTSQTQSGTSAGDSTGTPPVTGGCCGGYYQNGAVRCSDAPDEAACTINSGGQGQFFSGKTCTTDQSGYGSCQ